MFLVLVYHKLMVAIIILNSTILDDSPNRYLTTKEWRQNFTSISWEATSKWVLNVQYTSLLWTSCIASYIPTSLSVEPWKALNQNSHTCQIHVSWWTIPVLWDLFATPLLFNNIKHAQALNNPLVNVRCRLQECKGTHFKTMNVCQFHLQPTIH